MILSYQHLQLLGKPGIGLGDQRPVEPFLRNPHIVTRRTGRNRINSYIVLVVF
jgi:hypothetical protein